MRHALLLLLLSICLPARAEMMLETINLHNRPANEVISILQPMLDKGGGISGAGYKLFVRSSPENIAQIRQEVQELDAPVQNLLVSVSMDPEVMQENTQVSARISVNQGQATIQAGGNGGVNIGTSGHGHHKGRIMYDARMLERAHTERAPQAQTVRVSEGSWATIHTGQGVPIASRTRNLDGTVTDTYTYRAVTTGFQVLPRVNGDNVILMIRPQAQTLSARNDGSYGTTEINTTVTGKLGHWIPLGSIAQIQQSNSSGIAYRANESQEQFNQFYVKVELANP